MRRAESRRVARELAAAEREREEEDAEKRRAEDEYVQISLELEEQERLEEQQRREQEVQEHENLQAFSHQELTSISHTGERLLLPPLPPSLAPPSRAEFDALITQGRVHDIEMSDLKTQVSGLERQMRELMSHMSATSSFVESPNNSTTLETLDSSDTMNENDCFLCLVEASTVVLFPCKHLCICHKCSANPSVILCPLCSEEIESRLSFVPK